jgi:hypothetical protein
LSVLFIVQDSDERAVAYIAGKAPNRWGPFGAKEAPSGTPMMVVPPVLPPPNATAAQLGRAAEIRRAHPLYADVTLRLLTEIMNSRLFTTVCLLTFCPSSQNTIQNACSRRVLTVWLRAVDTIGDPLVEQCSRF